MSDWRPGASRAALHRRAELLTKVREFFLARDVLEVETPLLARHTVSDPSLEALQVALAEERYLQTSPEYAMKRLLAAGSGPIYQICKAFRDDENGRRHNPEFTLLEWYRPGFGMFDLVQEVADLLLLCLGCEDWQKISYRALFLNYLGVDVSSATAPELAALARAHVDVGDLNGDRDLWLDLLMSHCIEPELTGIVCVYDYPATQAALARVESVDGVDVARRFEFYVDGIELANGYHELVDPAEQSRRFAADNSLRAARGQVPRDADLWLLNALDSGLPDCSGVALGFDRLLMLACDAPDIRDVLAFDWSRC